MLTVNSLDCQSETIHLDLLGYAEPAQARGVDVVIPGAAGRVTGIRVKDVYRFTLQGYVKGVGETRDDRAESWRAATDLLMAAIDFTADPGTVEVGPTAPAQFPNSSPYLGLAGEHSLLARCVSLVRGPVQNHMSFQSWSFEMECIDNPPEWVPSGSSSP